MRRGKGEENAGSRRWRGGEKGTELVLVGEVWCCFYRANIYMCVRECACVPMQQWRKLPRVKPPRDPVVISVIDTNMFIVLLCPIGEKDPIIIM